MHGAGAGVGTTRDFLRLVRSNSGFLLASPGRALANGKPEFKCFVGLWTIETITIKTGPIVKILESQVDRSYLYLVWTQCCSACPFYLVVFLWFLPSYLATEEHIKIISYFC